MGVASTLEGTDVVVYVVVIEPSCGLPNPDESGKNRGVFNMVLPIKKVK